MYQMLPNPILAEKLNDWVNIVDALTFLDCDIRGFINVRNAHLIQIVDAREFYGRKIVRLPKLIDLSVWRRRNIRLI